MEKYDAILRLINDKLESQEGIIEMYRKESAEKSETIREFRNKVGDLELALCDETQKNNELTSENKDLKETLETLEDENIELRNTIEALKSEINNISNF